jgi:hypothetical protein
MDRKVIWADLSQKERGTLQNAIDDIDDLGIGDIEWEILEARGFADRAYGIWAVNQAGLDCYNNAKKDWDERQAHTPTPPASDYDHEDEAWRYEIYDELGTPAPAAEPAVDGAGDARILKAPDRDELMFHAVNAPDFIVEMLMDSRAEVERLTAAMLKVANFAALAMRKDSAEAMAFDMMTIEDALRAASADGGSGENAK